MSENSQPQARWIPFAIGIAGSFLIMAALVWVMYHYTQPPPVGQARVLEREKALADLRAADAQTLNNYGWVDQAKGIVRLPISQAMQLTVKEYQNPAAARADLVARADRSAAPAPAPPKAQEKPNPYE